MPNALTPLAAAALALAAASPLHAMPIDSFDGSYTTNTVYFSSGPPVQALLERTESAAVPGGTRRTQLVADPAAPGTSSASLNGSGDLWAFAGGGQRLDFNFAYGTSSAMNLDLSASNVLRLDMYFNSPMKLVVYATTETMAGANPDGSAFSIDIPELFQQFVDIPLAGFVTNSATGRSVNWADVDGLAFFVSATGPLPSYGDAFWVRDLSAVSVPEPSSALLIAAGLVPLFGLRRAGKGR